MASTNYIEVNSEVLVWKEKYEQLEKKYNELQNKYDALKEVYQNEVNINSLAAQPIKQTEMNKTYTPLNTSATKLTSFGGVVQTDWKEGMNVGFNIFE